jgi:hypothetical protein
MPTHRGHGDIRGSRHMAMGSSEPPCSSDSLSIRMTQSTPLTLAPGASELTAEESMLPPLCALSRRARSAFGSFLFLPALAGLGIPVWPTANHLRGASFQSVWGECWCHRGADSLLEVFCLPCMKPDVLIPCAGSPAASACSRAISHHSRSPRVCKEGSRRTWPRHSFNPADDLIFVC